VIGKMCSVCSVCAHIGISPRDFNLECRIFLGLRQTAGEQEQSEDRLTVCQDISNDKVYLLLVTIDFLLGAEEVILMAAP